MKTVVLTLAFLSNIVLKCSISAGNLDTVYCCIAQKLVQLDFTL